MLRRKDGAKTRGLIFETACRIFGELGYRGATHALICEQAGTNIASINYHFGSKEELYREVCAYALQEMETRFPLSIEKSEAPEERLRSFVATLLARGAEGEQWGFYHGLRMHESREPSGIADDLWDPWFQQHREALQAILGDLLQEAVTPENLQRCYVNIVGPCFMVNFARGKRNGVLLSLFDSDDDALVDHIVSFSVAGIAAVREEWKTSVGFLGAGESGPG